jgi:hypothetical protein
MYPRTTLRTTVAHASASMCVPFPCEDGRNINIPAFLFTVSIQGKTLDVTKTGPALQLSVSSVVKSAASVRRELRTRLNARPPPVVRCTCHSQFLSASRRDVLRLSPPLLSRQTPNDGGGKGRSFVPRLMLICSKEGNSNAPANFKDDVTATN